MALWEKAKRVWSALIDQDNLRDIEIAFVDLETAIRQQNPAEAEKELTQLKFYLLHVAESEKIYIENVL